MALVVQKYSSVETEARAETLALVVKHPEDAIKRLSPFPVALSDVRNRIRIDSGPDEHDVFLCHPYRLVHVTAAQSVDDGLMTGPDFDKI